jgi:AraC-like DNA-binding protein
MTADAFADPHRELTLSVSGQSGQDEIRHFFDACAPIFSSDLEQRAENRGYTVNLNGVQLGPLVMSKVLMTGGRFHYQRDSRLIATSGLDLILVQIITEGSDTRIVNGQEVRSRPGDIFIADLTRSIRTMASHCGNYSFVLPRSAFGMREDELDRLHDHFLPANSTAARLVLNHIGALWGERHAIGADEAASVSSATAAMIGGFMASYSAAEPDGSGGSKYLQICQHIDMNLADSALSPEELSRRFSISRAALYRLFSSTDGVANYIRERRLRHAFRKLVSTDHSRVSAIGFSSGFSNTSSFIRAFRTKFGITPGEAIESAAQRSIQSLETVSRDGASMLRAWIQHADRG